MNRLLRRRWLSELAEDAAYGLPEGADGLTTIPFEVVADRLGIPLINDPAMRNSFLLWEDESAAHSRRMAASQTAGPPPARFTVASAVLGGVFYLPDEVGRAKTVQLFVDYGGTYARVRAELGPGTDSAPESWTFSSIETLNPVDSGCPDGPCVWRDACGPGCRCRMYATSAAYSGRKLADQADYVLRCR